MGGHLGGAEAGKIVGKARLGFKTSGSECGYREAGSAGAEGTCKVLERQLGGGSGGDRGEVKKRSRSRRLEGAEDCRDRSEAKAYIYGAILIWVWFGFVMDWI